MADQDLTILDETKPNGNTEEVSVLDEYQRETRKKLKAWASIEHDPVTGAHIIPHGALPGTALDGKLSYHDDQRELLMASGGVWQSVAQPTFNYIVNGMFNQFSTVPVATTTFPGWTPIGITPNIIHQTIGIYGTDNVRIRTVVDFAILHQAIANNVGTTAPFSPISYWKGRTVTFGVMVRTSVANNAYIRISDGVTVVNSPMHVGDNLWRWMTVTLRVGSAATALIVEIVAVVIGGNAFFSGATLVEGHSCPHPLPPSWQGRQGILNFGSFDAQPNTNTPWWYGPTGHAVTPVGVQAYLPFDAMVRNFYVNTVADIGAGTFTAQVEHAGVLTPLLVTLTGAVHAGSFTTPDNYIGAKTGGWSAKVTRNGGSSNAFFSSLVFEEVPSMP